MALLYEANPPKLDDGVVDATGRFVERLRDISDVCGGVHITENVLGIRRVSPILVGRRLRDVVPDIPMTLTMRVRDKSSADTDAFVDGAVEAGFSGMLVVAGDPAPNTPPSGQVPSRVVRRLLQNQLAPGLDLYLSIPADPDYVSMVSKLDARPRGFITQVIQNPDQVESMVARLPKYDILPIVLYPSPKNQKAATFLGIHMEAYSDGFGGFIRRIHDATGNVLITSPGDYASLYGFLSENRY
jgi:homocysteine S-methyltransferase